MKPSTRSSYLRRIDRVIGFLNKHVEASPGLDDLAGIAAISPFHFHRVYRAITGETPSGTLRRLRIARALVLLRDSGKPVTGIAFDVGFESSQGFSKALRATTGCSATELRGNPARLDAILKSLSRAPKMPGETKEIDVRLVSVEPFRVIASRHRGPHEKLNESYRRLYGWAEAQGALADFSGIYGLPLDDPRAVDPKDCRFDCAFDLGPLAVPGDGMKALMLGGEDYAVIRHRGPYEGLDAKYDYLYGVWLPGSRFMVRDKPTFNHYLNDPDSAPPEDWKTDIYLPVAEASAG